MVVLRYSGGVANQFATASLGGGISDTPIPDNELQNLWDDVNRVEVINGRTEYRCFYLLNDEAIDYTKIRLIQIVIPADTEIAFGIDNSVLPQLLVTEDTTPTGLTFFDFDEWDDLEVPLGTFDQGEYLAIWMRRKVIVGSNAERLITLVIDGQENTLTFSQDFESTMNSFDNEHIDPRSSQFLTDVDFVGEALTS